MDFSLTDEDGNPLPLREVEEVDDDFKNAATAVIDEFFNGSETAFNTHIAIVLWELHYNAERAGVLVKDSNVLWQTIREGNPRLRIYYVLLNGTCRLKWVEVDPEWAAAHAPLNDA